MRVISGIYKRRRFDVPHSFKARPTTDFAKENLFNVLSNYMDFEDGIKSGKIEYIKQEVIDKYLDKVAQQGVHTDLVADSGLKVVYTPLNGTGNKPVRAILKKIGIKEVTVVPEQENPDGNFPTCPFPNPEIKEALAKGLELCKTVKPDLLLATDPDLSLIHI